MNEMELLAPAGSPQHLLAALEGGADAVYLAGKAFGARRFAGNFSPEEMKEAVRLSHIRGTAVYVTVNTLVSDQEAAELEDYLRFLGSLPVDGIIVQDLGVAARAHAVIPHIPLHASTQMTVANLAGVEFLKSLHFTRAVLARELSLAEIRAITEGTDMEIEVFVHGALCVCYSGQCLMSSFIGGRSGNRGACAQPCRLPYTLTDSAGRPMGKGKGRYILSMKDMTALPRMKDLAASGACSLKIEGRMKSPEYVYETVSAYRKVLTELAEGKESDTAPIQRHLEEGFSRGYTHAYYDGKPGPSMMTGFAPGNHGVLAGKVQSSRTGEFRFRAAFPIDEGRMTGISYVTASDAMAFAGREAVRPLGKGLYQVRTKAAPRKEGPVYWHAEEEKKDFSLGKMDNKVPVSITVAAGAGEPVTMTVSDGVHTVTEASEYRAEKAEKRVTTEEEARKQAARMGNTLFFCKSFALHNEGCMIPRSIINQLRQQAVEALEEERRKASEEHILADEGADAFSFRLKKEELSKAPLLAVRTDKKEQAEAAVRGGAAMVIFGGESLSHEAISLNEYEEVLDLCREKGVRIVFALPRVVQQKESLFVKNRFLHLADMGPDAIETGWLGALTWTKELRKAVVMEGGASLNLFNSAAVAEVDKLGFSAAVLSPELTLSQIRKLTEKTRMPLGASVWGRPEMMISNYCAIQSVMTDVDKTRCPAPCRKGRYLLRDEEGRAFPVRTDEFCRMHILNCRLLDMRPYVNDLRQSGISRFIVDLRGSDEDGEALCRSWKEIMEGKRPAPPKNTGGQNVTRGHFFRGVM